MWKYIQSFNVVCKIPSCNNLEKNLETFFYKRNKTLFFLNTFFLFCFTWNSRWNPIKPRAGTENRFKIFIFFFKKNIINVFISYYFFQKSHKHFHFFFNNNIHIYKNNKIFKQFTMRDFPEVLSSRTSTTSLNFVRIN